MLRGSLRKQSSISRKCNMENNTHITKIIIIPNPVLHSRHRLAVADPSLQIRLLQLTKIVKLQVLNEISNIFVHVQCSLHLLKARTTMDNIFLSHSYILVFPPKSLFSITLILICITLSLVTLLGNHFSSLHCVTRH